MLSIKPEDRPTFAEISAEMNSWKDIPEPMETSDTSVKSKAGPSGCKFAFLLGVVQMYREKNGTLNGRFILSPNGIPL